MYMYIGIFRMEYSDGLVLILQNDAMHVTWNEMDIRSSKFNDLDTIFKVKI